MSKSAHDAAGQTVLEFLLVLLILVPLLFGGIELARGVGLRHALDSGTAVAARALGLDPAQWIWANNVIQQTVADNVLGGGSASVPVVQAYNATGTALTPGALTSLPFGSTFRLEASLTYTPNLALVSSKAVTIRVSHWSTVERYP